MEQDLQPLPDEKRPLNYPEDFDKALGLAVASLVLGLLSLSLSIFVIGAIGGLIGLILAVVHLRKERPLRTLARWGLVLSILGCLAGTGFGLYYGISIYKSYKQMDRLTSDEYDLILRKYIGTETPDFTMVDIEGNEITLSSLKGRRVVLNFWATWCPPCRMEIPQLINLRKEVHPSDLAIIGISDEDRRELLDFVAKKNINYTIATAEDLPAPYNYVSAIPTTFFIDRRGIIQDIVSGFSSLAELKEKALSPDYMADSNEPGLPVK